MVLNEINPGNFFVENEKRYATHRNDVGKISAPFRKKLKPDAKLKTQRHTKINILHRKELNDLMCDLQKNSKKNRMAQRFMKNRIMELLF